MGIPKSMIDKFPPHIQKQIRSQFASKTRMEEIADEENPEKKSKYSSAKLIVRKGKLGGGIHKIYRQSI